MAERDRRREGILQGIVEELKTRHGCHTVILYGSQALGTATDASDYDVLGVRETGMRIRDGRRLGEIYLDAAIHPESDFEPMPDEMIRLRSGLVLAQKGDFGERLVAGAKARFEAGPKPLEATEAEHARSWIRKSLGRVARGGPDDAEAAYRRVWLLTQLLEDYFRLRGRWYLGPKESFAWLERHEPRAHALFAAALAPDAARGTLRLLAEHVISGT